MSGDGDVLGTQVHVRDAAYWLSSFSFHSIVHISLLHNIHQNRKKTILIMGTVREKSTSGFSAARTNKQKPVTRHVEHPPPSDGQSQRERVRFYCVREEKLAVTDFVVPPRTHTHSEFEFEFEFQSECVCVREREREREREAQAQIQKQHHPQQYSE